jgi:hypothetical protein
VGEASVPLGEDSNRLLAAAALVVVLLRRDAVVRLSVPLAVVALLLMLQRRSVQGRVVCAHRFFHRTEAVCD